MHWLNKQDSDEWLQDPLVSRLREEIQGKLAGALKRLREAARRSSDPVVRAAEQKLLDTEEFLGYLEDKEER